MIEKRKGIILKLLICFIAVLALMIIKGTTSQAFTQGGIDVDGSTGMPIAPEPYQEGDRWCSNHANHLVVTEDGTKNTSPIVHINRIKGSDYYNQESTYTEDVEFDDIEQSIAAGFLAYKRRAGTQDEFQTVVWASGQWKEKAGYVNNLGKYTGTTLNGGGSALSDRAEGWASFYYNYLYPNGGQLLIDVQPTSEEDIRVYVDQNARTYTEGPYMINLLDASGGIATNKAATYHSAGTIGNLLYQEISGLNVGCSIFQFAKLNSATATVTYTDGSTEEFSTITILDANGGVLTFPKPGEVFYIRIEIPAGETRTVAKIEPHFSVNYLTKISGTATQYVASAIVYELNVETSEKLTDSTCYADDGRLTKYYTNDSILTLRENHRVINQEDLNHYLEGLILDDENIVGIRGTSEFKAEFRDYVDRWTGMDF